MLGNMMSGQLLISGLIEHAEKYHNDAEIVSKRTLALILLLGIPSSSSANVNMSSQSCDSFAFSSFGI